MIQHSEAYAAAVTARSRKQYVRAVFDLIDPDAVFGAVTTNDESPYSLTQQVVVRDAEESEETLGTLEIDRWILDGSITIPPTNKNQRKGQVGWESSSICDENGNFPAPFPYVEAAVSEIEYLQAVSFYFSHKAVNGVPEAFLLEIWSGSTLAASETVTDNAEHFVIVDGFTVTWPTRVRLTVQRWSMGYRRVRVPQLIIGLYERWSGGDIESVDLYTESTFSGLALPYSTCALTVRNVDYRYDPFAPNSIFKSIEERQAIRIEFGAETEDGTIAWIPAGVYYLQSGGWALKELTIEWKLLDVVGMLAKKRFTAPSPAPTTLSGWLRAIMGNLGSSFAGRYVADSDVASTYLWTDVEKVNGKYCGEVLRYLCMATNTWPRQEMGTGKLRVGKLQTAQGNKIRLDDMYKYPDLEGNDDIADITFKLDDVTDEEGNTSPAEATFPGTNTDSEVSLMVNNPFVHTAEDARKAVISCLFEYGGQYFKVVSRGNPSSETGDIQRFENQYGNDLKGRLYKQQLKIENGVMLEMPSFFVQSPNDNPYTNRAQITQSGTWTAPANVSQIQIILIQGGQGSGRGEDGYVGGSGSNLPGGGVSAWEGEKGVDGTGGKIWIGTIEINPQQSFDVRVGQGGAPSGVYGSAGSMGGETTFGAYTSADGSTYSQGFMEIITGSSYGRTGVAYPMDGTGDGAAGGAGGTPGRGYWKALYWPDGRPRGHDFIVTVEPGPGSPGRRGASGCVLVYWDEDETEAG